ncbi:MarR family winged helix-turn-helix transcriptional regulator [Streptomyces sp. NPDC059173]|uniref:MarR family winged helix-turn-helix transcriptional regulator n=1 Tax=Streptomyces sp. NPDC059173 TaxID=3346756 RepID=UPI0036CB0C70
MDAPDSLDGPDAPDSPHSPDGRSRDSRESGESRESRDGVLAEQLLRLTRRLHRIQRRQLEPIDITPAQFRLLRTVASYGAAPRMADLARRLDVVPRAVTTLVDGLEASGRVRRAPDPDSRRVVRIEITDEGRATLRSLRSARRAAAEEILAPLTADQREVFGELLSALVDGMPERHC